MVIDNLATGSLENVNPGAKFYKVSICDAELANVFEQERPEIVGHQAAQTAVTKSGDESMFDTLAQMLGYSGEPVYASVRTGEIYRICLDATKAQKS